MTAPLYSLRPCDSEPWPLRLAGSALCRASSVPAAPSLPSPSPSPVASCQTLRATVLHFGHYSFVEPLLLVCLLGAALPARMCTPPQQPKVPTLSAASFAASPTLQDCESDPSHTAPNPPPPSVPARSHMVFVSQVTHPSQPRPSNHPSHPSPAPVHLRTIHDQRCRPPPIAAPSLCQPALQPHNRPLFACARSCALLRRNRRSPLLVVMAYIVMLIYLWHI